MTHGENDFLIAPFIEKEIRDVVFDMEPNKELGPDDIPSEFY